jgi:hypothetical protein
MYPDALILSYTEAQQKGLPRKVSALETFIPHGSRYKIETKGPERPKVATLR